MTKFCIRNLSTENCLKFWRLAIRINNTKMIDKCTEFIDRNARQLFNLQDATFISPLSLEETFQLFQRTTLTLSEMEKIQYLNRLKIQNPRLDLNCLKNTISYDHLNLNEMIALGQTQLYTHEEFMELLRKWNEHNSKFNYVFKKLLFYKCF
mgnify:CR=1 FL=1